MRGPAGGPAVRPVAVVLTCEHGGNRIPRPYARYFQDHADKLASHEGFDAGALELARELQARLGAPLVYSTVSLLLIELNRSADNPELFSALVRGLPFRERQALVTTYYHPYRAKVERLVAGAIARGRCVVHLSCHSFTPRMNGSVRNADVGLLFDPERRLERAFCTAWRNALREDTTLLVRHNYPYRGTDEGLTTWLRSRFPPQRYLGLEIEVNQKHPLGAAGAWRIMRMRIARSFAVAVRHLERMEIAPRRHEPLARRAGARASSDAAPR